MSEFRIGDKVRDKADPEEHATVIGILSHGQIRILWDGVGEVTGDWPADGFELLAPAVIEPTEPLHVRLASLARALEGEYPPHVIEDVLEASRIAALPLHEGSGE